MCGNCGWFTQRDAIPSANTRRIITNVMGGLLVANSTRGTDATGIGVVSRSGISSIYKKASPSHKFVDMPKAKRIMRKDEAMIMLGHTRLGTTGANTDANAHPFLEGTVMGTHNGIIWNHFELDDATSNMFKRFSVVDSQAAFRIIAAETNNVEALAQIEGDAALIWHDTREPDVLNLVRHANPLSLAYVPRIKTLFWSSQFDHLAAALYAGWGGNWYSIPLVEDELIKFHADDLLDFKTTKVRFASRMAKKTTYVYNEKGQLTTASAASGFSLMDRLATEHDDEEKKRGRLRNSNRSSRYEHWWRQSQSIDGIDDAADEIEGGFSCEVCSTEIPNYMSVTEVGDVTMCARCFDWWEADGSTFFANVEELVAAGLPFDSSQWDAPNDDEAFKQRALTVLKS